MLGSNSFISGVFCDQGIPGGYQYYSLRKYTEINKFQWILPIRAHAFRYVICSSPPLVGSDFDFQMLEGNMLEVSKTQGIWPAAGGFFLQFSNKKYIFYTAKHGEITLQQIWNLPRCWSAHERGLCSWTCEIESRVILTNILKMKSRIFAAIKII